jgi:superfamily II DNA/RNA helicase
LSNIGLFENNYRDFFSQGVGDTELLNDFENFREFVFSAGTARELLLIDLIGAITRKKIQNSAWKSLPNYSGLSIETWKEVLQKPTFSIKELWPAQHLIGQHGVFQGSSAAIQIPTSAGKTKAIELIIRSAFYSNRTTLCVIVTPFRALCHEIKETLSAEFKDESVYVNELSDVFDVDYSFESYLGKKLIIVVTPEKLDFVLRHTPSIGENIGLIVYDEGHQFDNGVRGITYELLLTSLKEKLKPNVQSVLISAVISNGSQIGIWLNGEKSEFVTSNNLNPAFKSLAFASWTDYLGQLHFVDPKNIDADEYFVPRLIDQYQLQLFGQEKKVRMFPERTNGKDIALFLGLRIVSKGSVAIFCGTKITVGTLCERIIEIYSRGLPLQKPYDCSDKREVDKIVLLFEKNMGANSIYTSASKFGLFPHHNNIPHGLRLSIEYALSEGMINFVICTSTLAQGVNLPLRYLIVTSTYEGEESIKTRDFQNLIGRTGRAKFHTEGTVIFSDPEVYDNRSKRNERWRWTKVKSLLNPLDSEPCISTLFSIFTPLSSIDKKQVIKMEPLDLVKKYIDGKHTIDSFIGEVADHYSKYGFPLKELQKQVKRKIDIILKVESFLMAHFDLAHPELPDNEVETLAKDTLAFNLADDVQKEQIVNLFLLLARNINKKIPDPRTRFIFGKTTFGINDSLIIREWLKDNLVSMIAAEDMFELLRIIWPILRMNIHNSAFTKCDKPEIMLTIIEEWAHGQSYEGLFEIMQKSGVRQIFGSQFREYKIENMVDICDNGFSFDGSLVLSALVDLLDLFDNEKIQNLKILLQDLQKAIKYGLSSKTAILLFEMGFSDRIIAQLLVPIFEDLQPTNPRIRRSLRSRHVDVFKVLDNFPSYFSNVYRNLIS